MIPTSFPFGTRDHGIARAPEGVVGRLAFPGSRRRSDRRTARRPPRASPRRIRSTHGCSRSPGAMRRCRCRASSRLSKLAELAGWNALSRSRILGGSTRERCRDGAAHQRARAADRRRRSPGWTPRPRPPRDADAGPALPARGARRRDGTRRRCTRRTRRTPTGATGPICRTARSRRRRTTRGGRVVRRRSDDPLFYAIVDLATQRPVGVASYLRIDPAMGTIEVGHLRYAPALQRTPASTEAMYLMMRRAFDELGYRRYEWKCDSLNAPSVAAAKRLGFRFEGIFRQAMVVEGPQPRHRVVLDPRHASGPRCAPRSSAGSIPRTSTRRARSAARCRPSCRSERSERARRDPAAARDGIDARDVPAALARWATWHWFRTALSIVAFAASLVALR